MSMAMATATEMQNNFGRYLSLVMSGQEIIVTKNGKEVGRFVPHEASVSYLTDSLKGILKAKSPEKIDGIVAAIMALDRCIRHEQTGSVYDDPEHGLLVF